MTVEEAARQLRSDPRYADLIRDSYVELDVRGCAERFLASAEFAEVRALLGGRLQGATVLDLGAGNGIASYAMAKCGAGIVYALEPDPSNEIGQGAIRSLSQGLPIQAISSVGEEIPLRDAEVDIVYARQVLHHIRDLPRVIKECTRVLKHGGMFLACREHVVDSQQQLRVFLSNHPVHRLAGGEGAFPLNTYVEAIRLSGLELIRTLGPYDTVINAFPAVRSRTELEQLPRILLERRFGWAGRAVSIVPGVQWLVWRHVRRPVPGRLYSFTATKP